MSRVLSKKGKNKVQAKRARLCLGERKYTSSSKISDGWMDVQDGFITFGHSGAGP